MSQLLKFLDVEPLGATAADYGTTLADCQSMASQFANTCSTYPNPLNNLSANQGELMSCTGKNMCPGKTGQKTYTTSDPCEYYRKTCVTCSENSDGVYIRF
jgi:hypothetical protein